MVLRSSALADGLVPVVPVTFETTESTNQPGCSIHQLGPYLPDRQEIILSGSNFEATDGGSGGDFNPDEQFDPSGFNDIDGQYLFVNDTESLIPVQLDGLNFEIYQGTEDGPSQASQGNWHKAPRNPGDHFRPGHSWNPESYEIVDQDGWNPGYQEPRILRTSLVILLRYPSSKGSHSRSLPAGMAVVVVVVPSLLKWSPCLHHLWRSGRFHHRNRWLMTSTGSRW